MGQRISNLEFSANSLANNTLIQQWRKAVGGVKLARSFLKLNEVRYRELCVFFLSFDKPHFIPTILVLSVMINQ